MWRGSDYWKRLVLSTHLAAIPQNWARLGNLHRCCLRSIFWLQSNTNSQHRTKNKNTQNPFIWKLSNNCMKTNVWCWIRQNCNSSVRRSSVVCKSSKLDTVTEWRNLRNYSNLQYLEQWFQRNHIEHLQLPHKPYQTLMQGGAKISVTQNGVSSASVKPDWQFQKVTDAWWLQAIQVKEPGSTLSWAVDGSLP